MWLQLVISLQLYQTGYPAYTEIYQQQLKYFVNFEGIKLGNLLKLIDEDLTLMKIVQLDKGDENIESSDSAMASGYQSDNIILNILE